MGRPRSGVTLPAPPHSKAAHDAITAELVACTLGQRQRPELRTDMAGRLTHMAAMFTRALRRT